MYGDNFTWTTGICYDCKESKHVGKPWIMTLCQQPHHELRWSIDNLPNRCEDCLTKLGLSRKMFVIPIKECEPLLIAIDKARAKAAIDLATRWNYMADHGGLDPSTFEPMQKVPVPYV